MKQFEVYQVNLDPTIGAGTKKSRLAVIISPNVMNKHLRTVIVAPLTNTKKGYPSRVSSQFQKKDGEVVPDQLRAVDKVRLVTKMGVLDRRTASAILGVLQTMFQ
ncbi:MAG TPA: type II toxin-antitoxin system PemK/MazF family toxin [Chitinophagaceae bacterium]|jgi:mRNA interferase MazF